MRVPNWIAVLSAAAIFAVPSGLDSCSIPPPEPIFSTVHRPADLRNAFLKGKIGVIQPSYERRYLIGAYRILSNVPLSADEIDAIYPVNKPRSVDPLNHTAPHGWMGERSRVPDTKYSNLYDLYKFKSGPVFYYYRNCLDDAFDSASRTLQQRAALWGIESGKVREWVAAQDRVFTNCSGRNAEIPEAPSPDLDPLLAADRRYQIASAYFYAGDWPKARYAFEEIARDKTSPWRDIALYLVARTFVREGTVDGNIDALRTAEERLKAVAGDPALRKWHAASLRLLDYVQLRIDPYARVAELGSAVSGKPGTRAASAESVADFLYLFGRLSDFRQPDMSRLAATSELADWVLTFEGRTRNSGDHAIERWRPKRNPAWLIAALLRADEKYLPEILPVARRIGPGAPEYEAAAYYGISRQLLRGRREEARQWADEALSRNLLLSSRNLILSERLKVARNWSEFLRFATRRPEPKLERVDENEYPADRPPTPTGTAPLFDEDAARALNWRVPLTLWMDGSRNSLLPAHLQLQMAQAGWVRAVLLGRDVEAKELMERIVRRQPKSAAVASEYLQADGSDAARFAAVFLMMRVSSLSPWLFPANGVASDLSKLSRSGGGWAFMGNCAQDEHERGEADFLSPGERGKNAEEWRALKTSAPSGAIYLANQAILWARNHPDDRRVPESLHLAVQGTRFGCRDLQTGLYSRRAFALLHERYSKSEWATKTKYWYK